MKPTYIQSTRIYPSPRNPQSHTLVTARPIPKGHGSAQNTLIMASRTSNGFYGGHQFSATVYQDSGKNSLAVSKDQTPDTDNSRDKVSIITSPSMIPHEKPEPPTFSRRGPQYTPPPEKMAIPAAGKSQFIRHACIVPKYSSTPTKSGGGSSAISECKKNVLDLLQKYSADAYKSLSGPVSACFEALEIASPKSPSVRPSSPSKVLEKLNAEFGQVHQSIWLNNATINVHCEKLGTILKTLMSGPSMTRQSHDAVSLDTLTVEHVQSKRRSQTPTTGTETAAENSPPSASALTVPIQKVVEAQKELAKLLAELKKKNDRVKQYEELFANKDDFIHSLMAAPPKPVPESPPVPVEVIREKDKEILSLKNSLRNYEARLSRSRSRVDQSGALSENEGSFASAAKIYEETTCLLSAVESIKKATILGSHEELEKCQSTLEDHKRSLSNLLSVSSPGLLYCKTKGETLGLFSKFHSTVTVMIHGMAKTFSNKVSTLEKRLEGFRTSLKALGQVRTRKSSDAKLTELKQSLIKATASKAAIHRELMSLRKRVSTPEASIVDSKPAIKKLAQKLCFSVEMMKNGVIDQKISLMKTNLSRLTNVVEVMRQKLKEKTSENQELKKKISLHASLEAALGKTKDELERVTSQKNRLKSVLIKYRIVMQRVGREQEAAGRGIAALKNSAETEIGKVKKVAAMMAQVRQRLGEMMQQWKAKNWGEIEKEGVWKERLKEKEKDILRHQTEINRLQGVNLGYRGVIGKYKRLMQEMAKEQESVGQVVSTIRLDTCKEVQTVKKTVGKLTIGILSIKNVLQTIPFSLRRKLLQKSAADSEKDARLARLQSVLRKYRSFVQYAVRNQADSARVISQIKSQLDTEVVGARTVFSQVKSRVDRLKNGILVSFVDVARQNIRTLADSLNEKSREIVFLGESRRIMAGNYLAQVRKAAETQEIFSRQIDSIRALIESELARSKTALEISRASLEDMKKRIGELSQKKSQRITQLKKKLSETQLELLNATRNQTRKSQELFTRLKTAEKSKDETISALQDSIKKKTEENQELTLKISEMEEDAENLKATINRKEAENEKITKVLKEVKRKLEIKAAVFAGLKRKMVEILSAVHQKIAGLREDAEIVKEVQREFREKMEDVATKLKTVQHKVAAEKIKLIRKFKGELQQITATKERSLRLAKAKLAVLVKTVKKTFMSVKEAMGRMREGNVALKKSMGNCIVAVARKIKERVKFCVTTTGEATKAKEAKYKAKITALKFAANKVKMVMGHFRGLFKEIVAQTKSCTISQKKLFASACSLLTKKVSSRSSPLPSPRKNTAEIRALQEAVKTAEQKYWELVDTSAQEIDTLKKIGETETAKWKSQLKEAQQKNDGAIKELKETRAENGRLKAAAQKCKELLIPLGKIPVPLQTMAKKIKETEYKLVNAIGSLEQLKEIVNSRFKAQSVTASPEKTPDEDWDMLEQKLAFAESQKKSLMAQLEQEKLKGYENSKAVSKATSDLAAVLEPFGIRPKKLLADVVKELGMFLKVNTEMGTILKLQALVKEKDQTNKELSASYVGKLEKLSNEKAEAQNALKEIKEEYLILLSNLPIGTEETRLYRISVLLNISQREFQAAQKFRVKVKAESDTKSVISR